MANAGGHGRCGDANADMTAHAGKRSARGTVSKRTTIPSSFIRTMTVGPGITPGLLTLHRHRKPVTTQALAG